MRTINTFLLRLLFCSILVSKLFNLLQHYECDRITFLFICKSKSMNFLLSGIKSARVKLDVLLKDLIKKTEER